MEIFTVADLIRYGFEQLIVKSEENNVIDFIEFKKQKEEAECQQL